MSSALMRGRTLDKRAVARAVLWRAARIETLKLRLQSRSRGQSINLGQLYTSEHNSFFTFMRSKSVEELSSKSIIQLRQEYCEIAR